MSMFRLKKLLEEDKEDKKVQELMSLLKSGDYYITDKPIYRGMSSEIDTFTIRGARERKGPRNTDDETHAFITMITDIFYPNHPNRNRSSFASLSYAFSNSYGDYVNILVPHKSAKIRFYRSDTWPKYTAYMADYFEGGIETIESLFDANVEGKVIELFQVIEIEFNKELGKLLRGVYRFFDGDMGINYIEDVFRNYSSLEEIIEELSSFIRESGKFWQERKTTFDFSVYEEHKVTDGLSDIKRGFEHTKKYFHEAQKSPIEDAGAQQEIIVEGKHLIIRTEWFGDHFMWNGGDIVYNEYFS